MHKFFSFLVTDLNLQFNGRKLKILEVQIQAYKSIRKYLSEFTVKKSLSVLY